MTPIRTTQRASAPAKPRHIAGSMLLTHQQRAQAYEQAKRQWQASNPAASAEQYEAAMQAIARRFGV